MSQGLFGWKGRLVREEEKLLAQLIFLSTWHFSKSSFCWLIKRGSEKKWSAGIARPLDVLSRQKNFDPVVLASLILICELRMITNGSLSIYSFLSLWTNCMEHNHQRIAWLQEKSWIKVYSTTTSRQESHQSSQPWGVPQGRRPTDEASGR